MRQLIALLALTFATNSFAANSSDVLVCKTTQDSMGIEFNFKYGELTVVDKDGNILVEDDGYNHQLMQLEVFPPIDSLTIWRHEEPETIILSLTRESELEAYRGRYLANDGKVHNVICF